MRYIVRELRAFEVEYVIDAESEKEAKRLEGTIIETNEHEDHSYELLGVEKVDEDFEM